MQTSRKPAAAVLTWSCVMTHTGMQDTTADSTCAQGMNVHGMCSVTQTRLRHCMRAGTPRSTPAHQLMCMAERRSHPCSVDAMASDQAEHHQEHAGCPFGSAACSCATSTTSSIHLFRAANSHAPPAACTQTPTGRTRPPQTKGCSHRSTAIEFHVPACRRREGAGGQGRVHAASRDSKRPSHMRRAWSQVKTHVPGVPGTTSALARPGSAMCQAYRDVNSVYVQRCRECDQNAATEAESGKLLRMMVDQEVSDGHSSRVSPSKPPADGPRKQPHQRFESVVPGAGSGGMWPSSQPLPATQRNAVDALCLLHSLRAPVCQHYTL